jgi:hypothetical protein
MLSVSLTRGLVDGEPDFIRSEEEDEDEEETSVKVTFTLATSARARDNHRINLDGMDFRGFNANPVMLFGHSSKDLPIGTWSDVTRDDTKKTQRLRGIANFASEEQNPFAASVARLVKAKILRMASIGWRTIEAIRDPELKNDDAYGLLFTRTELIEASIVPVGADPNALSSVRSLAGDSILSLRDWLESAIAIWPSEFGERPVNIFRAISGTTISVPAPIEPVERSFRIVSDCFRIKV